MPDLVVTFRPHWINGLWLRTFTDPFVQVDGAVTRCTWAGPTAIPVSGGPHRIRTFVRYRRLFRGDGGAGEAVIEVGERDVAATATNGPLNHDPFVPRAA